MNVCVDDDLICVVGIGNYLHEVWEAVADFCTDGRRDEDTGVQCGEQVQSVNTE